MADDAVVFPLANPVPEILPEASKAMASVIEPSEEGIIPSLFHPDVHPGVARAVAEEATREGIARIRVNPEEVEERLKTWRGFYEENVVPLNKERRNYL